jgi:hypothetical protein
MTNPYEPSKVKINPIARPTRRTRRLWLGGFITAVGLLALFVGYYYATQLVKIPDFRAEFLSNVMGVCFWGGFLLFVVGLGTLLSAQR